MTISGISAPPQVQQAASSSALHRQSHSRTPSVSDVDGQSSNAAAPSTGRVGKAVDITV